MPALQQLPDIFLERLKKIVPAESWDSVVASFARSNPVFIRVNTLKVSSEDIQKILTQRGEGFVSLKDYPDVLILQTERAAVGDWDLVKEGKIYLQAFSSMLPVLALSPQPKEQVLDFCAAPGSKTTQIAALMQNEGRLVAIEAVKGRFYRLKSVVELLGVTNATLKLLDARRFRTTELFDRILVDAPCSSEGRFKLSDAKSLAYWSPRKIKEMAHKQKGLLLAATRLLKPGGTLVYSTCTFAPEENEAVIDWCLRKTDGMMNVEPIALPGVASYPALGEWEERVYSPEVRHCWRVLPAENTEGFFIAKLSKKGN